MTTEQNPMQDCVSAVVDAFENLRRKMRGDTTGQELAAFAKLSTAVAALRAAGEPIGYVSAITLDTLRDNPGEGHGFVVGVPAYDTVIPLYAAQPAPSAIVREALEPFANMADHISDKSRDNRPIIYGVENIHAIQITVGDVRRAARALAALSSTPSPLMAAGEAGGQDLMDRAAHILNQATGGPEGWSQWDEAVMNVVREAADRLAALSSQPTRIDAAVRASETVEATSPATRDYAARVMGEPTRDQINAAAEVIWNDRDARHGGSWSSVDPNLIAAHQTIATARAALIAAANVTAAAEPTREEIDPAVGRVENLIADLQGEHEVMCGPFDPTKWKIDVSVSDLQAILALKPRGEPAREGGE